MRFVVQQIINDRRSGKEQKYEEGTTDLLEILIPNEFYKNNDELIIDEILSFFAAGVKTIHLSSTNLIWSMSKNPDMKEKLLAEVIPAVEAAKDDIANKLDYNTVMDFEYLHQCFYESLRMEPPFNISLQQCFSRDVTMFDGLTIKKDTNFFVNIEAMHHDPTQWVEPSRYMPDRFDSGSKWFKKPDGENRNALTFNPFLGGKRGCLGKTFAEVVVRYTIPIIYYHMDLEVNDPNWEKPNFNINSSEPT